MIEKGLIGGSNRGVPKRLFYWDCNSRGQFQHVGTGADELSVLVDVGCVHIQQPGGQYYFKADMIYGQGGRTVVQFDIVTVSQNGQHHPDLYAKKLFIASIGLFEAQGFNVNTIRGRWMSPPQRSINYGVFQDGLRRVQEEQPNLSLEQQHAQAALSTWTGSIAYDLGFTDIFVNQGGNYIAVSFQRPAPTNGLNVGSI